MHATHSSLLIWLGCFIPALAAIVTSELMQPRAASRYAMLPSEKVLVTHMSLLNVISPKIAVFASAHAASSNAINATLNAQGDATVDTPQFLATLLTSHFDVTCSPPEVGKKRLGKRGLTKDDQGCIALSAFSLAIFAASNLQVQDALSSIPVNFDVRGGLIDVKTKVRIMIQQSPSRFTARIFLLQSIQSTIAYFTTLAAWVWENGQGTEITHIGLTFSRQRQKQ